MRVQPKEGEGGRKGGREGERRGERRRETVLHPSIEVTNMPPEACHLWGPSVCSTHSRASGSWSQNVHEYVLEVPEKGEKLTDFALGRRSTRKGYGFLSKYLANICDVMGFSDRAGSRGAPRPLGDRARLPTKTSCLRGNGGLSCQGLEGLRGVYPGGQFMLKPILLVSTHDLGQVSPQSLFPHPACGAVA